MPADEKLRLKALLKAQGLPPLVTITHVLVTPNQHHDTSTVQHFWKQKLYPWIWENTKGLEGGQMFVRSDNCGGQFKSARHFRFISEHSSMPHSKGMRLLWSHFESCHGKDLVTCHAVIVTQYTTLLLSSNIPARCYYQAIPPHYYYHAIYHHAATTTQYTTTLLL